MIALVLGTFVQPAPLPAKALISAGLTGAILLLLGSLGIRSAEAERSTRATGLEKNAWAAVMRDAQLLIAVKDRAGRHRLVSQYLLDSWGASADQFIGHTDQEIAVDKEFGRRRHEEDLDYMAQGRKVQVEEQFPKMPGRKLSSDF
jgi:hypothetical protein